MMGERHRNRVTAQVLEATLEATLEALHHTVT